MSDKQLAESIIRKAMQSDVPVTVLIALLRAVFPGRRIVTRLG
jgi:hypothetical protein